MIPARYDSVRFPGKVLAKNTGKYLIQHTYEQACRAELLSKVIIATDSEKVLAACKEFGGECVMTSPDHQSGTDRIAEAVAAYDVKLATEATENTEVNKGTNSNTIKANMATEPLASLGVPSGHATQPSTFGGCHPSQATTGYDIVVNVQGDEPEIDPANIDKLAKLLVDNPKCQMATLVAAFESKEQVSDANIVKVIVDKNGYAIYFSRSVIPYDRTAGGAGDIKNYLRHLGIYAYRKGFLNTITKLPQTSLEKLEKLEQLRAIENGYQILTAKVEHTCDGIDTPQQYEAFVKRYSPERK